VRVPFIVRGPGVARGARASALVENVDIAPTIAALAGASVPEFVEGRSIVPLLRGERPAAWRQVALVEAYPGGAPDAQAERLGQRPRRARARAARAAMRDQSVEARYVALRGERFTFVKHRNGFTELYDLTKDPHQLENVAARTEPRVIEALSTWATEMNRCAGTACREISARVPEAAKALVAPRR